MKFTNKTALITGGSRGIGKAIAIKLAGEGANIVIASKTVTAHPKLEGTIYTAAEEIDKAGPGRVIPLQLDIRDHDAIQATVKEATDILGGIDILVNNASAIHLSSAETIQPKQFDLMYDINVRGTLFMSQACIPFLKRSANPHILNLSPPLNMDEKWFGSHLPYTMSKYGMSMIITGLSAELKQYGIAANALWPRTTIATAAVQNLLGGDEVVKRSRKPEIVAEAAALILQQPSAGCTGHFFTDEEVLLQHGMSDFDRYAVMPGERLMPDFFL